MQVTRYTALGVCLELLEAQTRILSCDFTKLDPRQGCDAMWGFLREVEQQVRALMVECRAQDELRVDKAQKKGDGKHAAEGIDSGTAGSVGSQADGGEPPAGAMEGSAGADGSTIGFADGVGVPGRVQVVAVGGKQMASRPLLEKLAGIMGGNVPPHQPPWADAAMKRAGDSKREGQTSFI